jgi:hypothetical protein
MPAACQRLLTFHLLKILFDLWNDDVIVMMMMMTNCDDV